MVFNVYRSLKNNRLDIRPYICFQLIERVVTYHEGVMFEEYTRFEGREDYVYFDDNYNIKCVTNIDDASVLCQADEPNVMLVKLVNEIREGSLKDKYEGILVIDFNALHNRAGHLLHYPNYRYKDLYIPLKIREYQDKAYYRAVELQRATKNALLFDEFYNMVRCYGWELTDDDHEYVYRLSNGMLEHLIQINRGRYKFKRIHK